jgi:protein-S-isoprenylcysteine O-methyltransferase Ste14
MFEIGNAWILMLGIVIFIPFFSGIFKKRGTPAPHEGEFSKLKRIFLISTKVIFIPAILYSFFLPLQIGTIWFYLGLPMALLGLFASYLVLRNWKGTDPDKPITSGLYKYSRHPMYVATVIFLIGVALSTASLVFLIFPVLFMIGAVVSADLEERQCLDRYGDDYRAYIEKTPRWIGLPKK